MITESDNDAASALWAEVGHGRLQYFLGRAKMTETQLGPGGYWGLTLITAHDEALLLNLLMYPNAVLDPGVPGLRAQPDGPGHPVPALGSARPVRPPT